MLNRLRNEFFKAASDAGYTPQVDEANPCIIRMAHFVIILGLLEACEHKPALEAVDRLLDDVLALRRVYKPAKASDIYLILAAPLNSEEDNNWKMLVAEIERDDRLARKHIWLPNSDGSNFGALVETTFLAKPWDTPEEDIKNLQLLNKGIDVPDGWEEALLDPELAGLALAEKLVALEGASTP